MIAPLDLIGCAVELLTIDGNAHYIKVNDVQILMDGSIHLICDNGGRHWIGRSIIWYKVLGNL